MPLNTKTLSPVALPTEPAKLLPQDTAKRRQILDGARQAFLEHGYDGASMGDIVTASGVSKATVYAYFQSKEQLFETLILEQRRGQAEQLFDLDASDRDVRRVLAALGRSFMAMMTRPETVQVLRIVIAAAGKFPEVGRAFFEAGPLCGKQRLTAYLQAQVAAGVLTIDDPKLAALQFMELCKAGIVIPMLMNVASDGTDGEAKIAKTVDRAVDVFMAAYGAP